MADMVVEGLKRPPEAEFPDVPTSHDFVGRQREMGELVAALDDV